MRKRGFLTRAYSPGITEDTPMRTAAQYERVERIIPSPIRAARFFVVVLLLLVPL
jgi:hypothetical protein